LFGFAEEDEGGRKIVPLDVTLQDVSITSCLVPHDGFKRKVLSRVMGSVCTAVSGLPPPLSFYALSPSLFPFSSIIFHIIEGKSVLR